MYVYECDAILCCRYDCQPGKEPLLVPGSEGDFEDPMPEEIAQLIAKYSS